MTKLKPFLKPEFEKRMKTLLKNDADFKAFCNCIKEEPQNAIRCNTLKIEVDELKKRLEAKGWKILQPFSDFPESMIIDSDLAPGELGKAREHLLGYYYVQEISSQLPLMTLKPKPDDFLLDCCAAPGSKTTQAAALMKNSGLIIANDNSLGRIKILASNLERCGVSNTIVTREDTEHLSKVIKEKSSFKFDKILVDAPCSGEGTLRSSLMASRAWNLKIIKKFSRNQKRIASSVIKILKPNATMIYSTCTHSPEENEEVVDYLIKNHNIELEKIKLPLKTRPGITEWEDKKYDEQLKNAVRIYPHDNDTEGFFICKIKKLGENKNEH